MKLAVFYHVWEGGDWQVPLTEFAGALRDSELEPDEVCLGVVGALWPLEAWAVRYGRPAEMVVSADRGYEWVTINALREYAELSDGAVLYAHAKGAENPSEHNARWRKAMIDALLKLKNVELLKDHDAVGPFWIEDWPQAGNRFFGGNFWMATCSYLRTLPECGTEHRWVPESWLGLNDPEIVDVLPGMPGPEFFGLPARA